VSVTRAERRRFAPLPVFDTALFRHYSWLGYVFTTAPGKTGE
jgi:hypothetical protein